MGTTYIIPMMGYLRTPAEYRDSEKILRTLISVAEQGYYITSQEETRQSLEAAGHLEPGIAPALYPHLEAYLSGTALYFYAEVYAIEDEGRRGEFHYGCLSLSAEDQMLLVDVDDWHFTISSGARDDPRYPQWQREVVALYAHWLDMLALVYRIWHPLYAYDYSGVGSFWPETSLADARTLQPRHLYEHNFFGPELVEKIGRERLLAAPAWQIRHFEDGSVLVVPNEMYGRDQTAPDTRPAVAKALGLPYDTEALGRYWQRLRNRTS
jgi:hypothetical protein